MVGSRGSVVVSSSNCALRTGRLAEAIAGPVEPETAGVAGFVPGTAVSADTTVRQNRHTTKVRRIRIVSFFIASSRTYSRRITYIAYGIVERRPRFAGYKALMCQNVIFTKISGLVLVDTVQRVL
jgi:hypothetical protein